MQEEKINITFHLQKIKASLKQLISHSSVIQKVNESNTPFYNKTGKYLAVFCCKSSKRITEGVVKVLPELAKFSELKTVTKRDTVLNDEIQTFMTNTETKIEELVSSMPNSLYKEKNLKVATDRMKAGQKIIKEFLTGVENIWSTKSRSRLPSFADMHKSLRKLGIKVNKDLEEFMQSAKLQLEIYNWKGAKDIAQIWKSLQTPLEVQDNTKFDLFDRMIEVSIQTGQFKLNPPNHGIQILTRFANFDGYPRKNSRDRR